MQAGLSLEGADFFYTNPLRKLHDFDYPLRWSRTRQPNIKSSFCCPPNVVRTIAEAHNYVYALSENAVWVNLYAASTQESAWINGERIKLRQETDYSWAGAIKLIIDEAPATRFALKLRIPGWMHAGAAKLRVNGEVADVDLTPGHHATLTRAWRVGDTVSLDLRFKSMLVESNPLVEETLNQGAVKYGPLVYCLESNDLPEGVRLTDVALTLRSAADLISTQKKVIAGAEVLTLTLPSVVKQNDAWTSGQLYREVGPARTEPIALKLVPYYAWGNRGDTEMNVWLPIR
ncbi:MAG: glycoside hydrolase family 127 protein [Candidatus Synoicihabitans palmerolidicus]|nr:glycoside hydrolase family 127 protein [Candidatus Synoicihabitans palmerolidicus]MCC5025758.1 glycoside hydrolase family 127 protein [Candidatus Synoicihabitans palmerolidicus]